MKVARILFIVALAISPWRFSEAQDSRLQLHDQSIVDSFFTPELVNAQNDPDFSNPDYRLTCFARLNSRTIVAGYSYGMSSAILLLKETDRDQYKKEFQVPGLLLTGGMCEVTPEQLTDDRPMQHEEHSHKQVTVGFAVSANGANSLEWVFDVEEDKLVNIGPGSIDGSGRFETDLSNYDLVNYYQDGTLQMVSGGEYPLSPDESAPEGGFDLYRLVNGKLQLDTSVSVVFDATINKDSSTMPDIPSFLKPTNLSGPFFVRLVNGDRHGEHKVKSATILLNGIAVAFLKQSDNIVEANVNLQDGDNEITVKKDCERSRNDPLQNGPFDPQRACENDEEMTVVVVAKTTQSTQQ